MGVVGLSGGFRVYVEVGDLGGKGGLGDGFWKGGKVGWGIRWDWGRENDKTFSSVSSSSPPPLSSSPLLSPPPPSLSQPLSPPSASPLLSPPPPSSLSSFSPQSSPSSPPSSHSSLKEKPVLKWVTLAPLHRLPPPPHTILILSRLRPLATTSTTST